MNFSELNSKPVSLLELNSTTTGAKMWESALFNGTNNTDFNTTYEEDWWSLFNETDFENFDENPVVPSEFPFAVLVVAVVYPHLSLHEYYQSCCTGTLVSEDLVITAASCIMPEGNEYPNPLGTTVYVRPNNTVLNARRIFIHPHYLSLEKVNLAAIVVDPSDLTSFPSIPTEMVEFNSQIDSCSIMGYGNQYTLSLQHFRTIGLSSNNTQAHKCPNNDFHLCLTLANLLPCPGDVGAPIICGGKLRAIFTPNEILNKCTDRYYRVFQTIFQSREWIRQIQNAPTIATLQWMRNPWYILLLCFVILLFMGGIYYVLVEYLQKAFEPMDQSSTSVGPHVRGPEPAWNWEEDN